MTPQSLIDFFIAEAEDHINTLERGILSLEKNPEDSSLIEEMFRTAHTLKGSASLVKLNVISKIAHLIEDVFEEIKDGKRTPTSHLATWLLKGIDNIKLLINQVRSGNKEEEHVFKIFEALLPLDSAERPLREETTEDKHEKQPDELVLEKRSEGRRRDDSETIESKFVRLNIDNIDQLMNIMGELTILKNYLQSQVKDVHKLKDEIGFSGGRLLTEVGNFSERYSYSLPDTVKYVDPLLSEFQELEFDRYDELNLFARKLHEITDDINEALKSLSEFFDSLSSKVNVMDRLINQSKELISEARMIPVGRLYQRFTRAVRDISLQNKKKVRFLTTGYETKIDKIIFERILESVLHLIRNAIAHGIETPEERVKKGKADYGTIHLNTQREGNTIVIEIIDDGRGIDFESIKSAAIKKGFVSADTHITDEDLLQILFTSGFSTAEKTDMTSGRGIGLDVVKETLSGINGAIEVLSEKDQGTTFRLKVPLSLIIINVVTFKSGGLDFIIPSILVQELTEIPIHELDDSDTVNLRDMVISIKNLNTIFGLPDQNVSKNKPAIILNVSGKHYGLVVDSLIGQEDTIIKPFGTFLEGIKHFSGVGISADGTIRPVINPPTLFKTPSFSLVQEPSDVLAERQKETVLVVDDSLSVRKFTSMILEAKNYHVFTATNGLEALYIIDENKVDLVITDLEMPVMHGYEFISELNRRGLLNIMPVIVLTSRSGKGHREKAHQLGASDFIIKPYDEITLMNTIRRTLQTHHLT